MQLFRNKFLISLCLSIASSCLFFWYIYSLEAKQTSFHFQSAAKDRIYLIEQEAVNRLHTIHAIEAFYNSSKFVNREEFSIFTKKLMEEYEGIQALEWMPNISYADRKNMVDLARADYGGFDIRAKVDGILVS